MYTTQIHTMGWFDWVFDALAFFGLYYKNAKILFLGLDNAGKTSLLMMLKDDQMHSMDPTFHPNYEELIVGNVKFHAHDLGGHEAARKLWRDYFTTVDGVVYIVDSTDAARFPEARKELEALLCDIEPHVPFLILGNKIDAQNAVGENELRAGLGYIQTTGKDRSRYLEGTQERPVEIFMCSVLRRMGYAEGFQWLSSFLT